MKLYQEMKVSFKLDDTDDWRFSVNHDPLGRPVGWVFLCPTGYLLLSTENVDAIGDQMFASYYWHVMLNNHD